MSVAEQARYLAESCAPGGMLIILDRVEIFGANPDLFQGCTLAAVNYENCFVVSGERSTILALEKRLGED